MITQIAMSRWIHSLYKQNGKPIARKKLYSRSFRENLPQELSAPTLALVQVCSLLKQFNTLEAEKNQLHDLICYLGVKLIGEEVKHLLGIKDISCLTATALMTDIVCVDRFTFATKFRSYLRTAPRISASNQMLHLGRVNKQGRIQDGARWPLSYSGVQQSLWGYDDERCWNLSPQQQDREVPNDLV